MTDTEHSKTSSSNEEEEEEHKTNLKHREIHAPAKSAIEERIELASLSGRVRNLPLGYYSQVSNF